MNQIEPKLKEAMEYVEKAQHIMTELGHTKYAICDMVSKQMLLDLEREVSELLGKLSRMDQKCNKLVKAFIDIKNELSTSRPCPVYYAAKITDEALAAVEGGSDE